MLELKQYIKNIGLAEFLFQVYFKGSEVKKKYEINKGMHHILVRKMIFPLDTF